MSKLRLVSAPPRFDPPVCFWKALFKPFWKFWVPEEALQFMWHARGSCKRSGRATYMLWHAVGEGVLGLIFDFLVEVASDSRCVLQLIIRSEVAALAANLCCWCACCALPAACVVLVIAAVLEYGWVWTSITGCWIWGLVVMLWKVSRMWSGDVAAVHVLEVTSLMETACYVCSGTWGYRPAVAVLCMLGWLWCPSD